MINVCPFCGHDLPHNLVDGLTSCLYCSRVFDSSNANRLLAAGHLLRQYPSTGLEQLISHTKLTEPEAIVVYALVADHGYSHDEMLKALGALGIPNRISSSG